MPLREWNVALGADKVAIVENASVTAVTGGAGAIGGGVGVRVLIDDAVATSRAEALRALDAVEQRLIEDTWPPS